MKGKHAFSVVLRNCLALVLIGSGACAHHVASPVVVPLQYDSALAKAGFPNPAARVTFNDRTAWFLFDTGAGVHTLADWFADAANMKLDDSLAEGVKGKDATGDSVAFRAVRGLEGHLAGETTLILDVAAVAKFPPMFETAEIGGLINPQLLAGHEQATTLDLRVPEFRIEPFKDAMRRINARQVNSDEVQICSAAESLIPNLLFAVLTRTQNGEGWLSLDSGAAVTKVTNASPLVRGVELEPGGETVGVAGRRQTYSRARELSMTFAGHPVSVDAAVVEKLGLDCGPDGLLGLDAIGQCAFVLGKESLAIACKSL
jgi:hypothetical protein